MAPEVLNGHEHSLFDFKRCGKNMSFLEQLDKTSEGKNTREIACWVVNDRYAFVVYRISDHSRKLPFCPSWDRVVQGSRGEAASTHDATCTLKMFPVIDTRLWEIVDNTDCKFTEVEGRSRPVSVRFSAEG